MFSFALPRIALTAAIMMTSMLAACGHDDKTYVIEDRDPEVVRETTVVRESDPVAVRAGVDLTGNDLQIVRQYYVERDCPQGFMRTESGCAAPTAVEKHYVVGEPLPRDVVIVDLPPDLVTQLRPLPAGYAYRIVDGDLVIVEESNLVVLDAEDLY